MISLRPHQAIHDMDETVAAGQFEFVKIEDDIIDAVFVKKYLLLRMDKTRLVNVVIEEAKPIMGPMCMLSVKCDLKVSDSI